MHKSARITKDPIQIGGKSFPISGRFKLTLNRDPQKFHATNINSFIPYGKSTESIVQFQGLRGPVDFLMITKLITPLDPDKHEIDAANVRVLIQHPNVRLEEMTDKEHELLVKANLKKDNPEFTLVNIDKQSLQIHTESRDMIDIQFMIMGTKTTLTKKKLMYIASALGLPTRSEIQDEERYMVQLQKTVISHLTVNKDDRAKFMLYYDKIADAEVLYFIEEMIAQGLIEEFGGMYKIGVKPVGFSIKDIREYFINQPEEYEAFKLEVQKFHNDKVTN
jgi:hypothetical protein